MNNRPPDRPDRSRLVSRPPSHRRIIRLVIGAVLSFTVAIALPFIAPRALFPTSMMNTSDRSAPVVVDGRAVFRVVDTAATNSAAARASIISQSLQKFADQELQPEIEVDIAKQGNLATIWLAYPSLETEDPKLQFNFTVTTSDTLGLTPVAQAEDWAAQLRTTFRQSTEQRQSDYIRQHMWMVLVIPILAALAHWLAGWLWRGHLNHFLRSMLMEDEQGKFTIVNLFLNATLLLLRSGIWISAFLYATNLFPDTRQISYQVIAQLNESFTAKTIPLGNAPISILDIFRVLALVLLVTLAAQVISNVLKRRVLQETGINRGVQEAISIMLRYGLIFVGTLIVLQASGINLSSLTLLASALGVGAGLGLQNIVKDVGSGLVLVFERPVQVGEFVQIGEQTGTVERIGARSAEIRTLDQVSIIVPNSKFLENEFVNWSHRNPISRIRIPVGVAYKSDPEVVRNLLLEVGAKHDEVLASPPVQVLFREFGDSALQFELLVWVSVPSRQFIIKSDLLFMLAKALRRKGIEIPFPQRDLHIITHHSPNYSSDHSPDHSPEEAFVAQIESKDGE
ncbi:MAG: mechanosensitive ion channel domain-containing protein [Phormidesmis sp.]